jgi:hypothetical protein
MMSNLRSLVIMFIGLRTAKKMHRRLLDHLMKVRKTPCWPRSWASCSRL